MGLSSMTGFARAEGAEGDWRWTWELKSVNGRNLEIRFRLPPGHDWIEGEARQVLQRALARGSVYANLGAAREAGSSELRVNEEALAQILPVLEDLKTKTGVAPATADGILALRGILEVSEPDEDEAARAARGAAMLGSLKEAAAALKAARAAEGAKIGEILGGQIERIEALTKDAGKCAAARPEALRERIKTQAEALLGAGKDLSEERLHQELALLAVKADVREEIDRLNAHVTAARELLGSGEPVGRRLDFLAQEFNREANTLCSKAGDIELTRIGLDLKAVIDQMREQVQNLE